MLPQPAANSASRTASAAETGTYTYNGESNSYKDGDKLTVKKPADGEAAVVELSAENEKGLPTYERIEITFREEYKIDKGAKVYFEKPESWGDEVYAYIYDVDENENKVWPGKEMTKEDDGKYSYTIERNWNSPLIIFNDGDYTDSVQYPEGKGLKVEADKTYSVKED